MMTIENQNLWDISLMATGHGEGIVALALANDKSITDELEAGDPFITAEVPIIDSDVKEYYRRHNVRPATAVGPLALTKDPCDLCTYFK